MDASGGGGPGPQRKGPRAIRSKKTLPAAFCSRESRLSSPFLPTDGPSSHVVATALPSAGSGVTGGSKENERSPAVLSAPSVPPPLVLGWSEGSGQEKVRLDSLVFLGPCPQRNKTFATKRMLHPPSLSLFCLIELPGAAHQRGPLRESLQDWLERWSSLQGDHPDLLVQLCETYWDTPLGYPMGILCEYMPLGSLDELIQACGGLPEVAMQEIAQSMVRALHLLHSAEPALAHGCLKPSQVLFGANGHPRLAFGLEQRIRGAQSWALPSPQRSPSGLREPGSITAADPCGTAVDIFDLGLLILVCALGGLEILLDTIPYAREFGGGRGGTAMLGTCALLQHELRSSLIGRPFDQEEPRCASPDSCGHLPPAQDLLFNREYSNDFVHFVSTCLEAHTRDEPISAGDLLQHPFLGEQGAVGPLVTLREMQNLAARLNLAPEKRSDPAAFGPAKSTSRFTVPGVAPSVAQSAQVYILNIAQAIAPYFVAGASEAGMPDAPWRQEDWESLVSDTARTLGLPRAAVNDALQSQIARQRRSGAGT